MNKGFYFNYFMKIQFFFLALISFNCYSQNWEILSPKLDSVARKYGYTDTTGVFIIEPKFDEVRGFFSDYAAVKIDTLWGVIDTNGKFVQIPQYSEISIIYRDHFIEGGTNFKFRSINGLIRYEYLFIPGPFAEMNNFMSDPEVMKHEDYELFVRIMQMLRHSCHYYPKNRFYNSIAISVEKYAIMTINFVLENPEKVISWINSDKEFEEAFKRGEIGCCGYGPVWYGK